MNILIIGCGQLGSRLANVLDQQNHDISVIDRDAAMLNLLNDDFSGLSVKGNPIDADVMRSAGIEGCDFVVCVTNSDNTNLMAAQIARNLFHIEHIIARVLDPVKSKVYKDLGIFTICPTTLAFESIVAALFQISNNQILPVGHSSLELTTVSFEKWMRGKTLEEIEALAQGRLIGFIDEQEHFMLYSAKKNRPIKESDRLVFVGVVD